MAVSSTSGWVFGLAQAELAAAGLVRSEMIRVSSGVSGEEIAVFNAEDFEGKDLISAKDLKQSLSTRIGCSRFQQKFYTEDGHEFGDDEMMTSMNLQLVMLELWPDDCEQAKELLLACQSKGTDKLEALLKSPLNPNVGDSNNWTALHEAAIIRRPDCVRLLLEAGAKCNLVDSTDEASPLHAAAWSGCLEAVQQLLAAGAETDRKTVETGATPLLLAAENGWDDIVELLVRAGAEQNVATTDTGETALHLAAKNGDCVLAELLVQFGVDQRKVTSNGATALHAATWEGCSTIVCLLLDSRCEPDPPTADNGETPLYTLCCSQGLR